MDECSVDLPFVATMTAANEQANSCSADLEDEKVKSEYERGYKQALDFFNEYL